MIFAPFRHVKARRVAREALIKKTSDARTSGHRTFEAAVMARVNPRREVLVPQRRRNADGAALAKR